MPDLPKTRESLPKIRGPAELVKAYSDAFREENAVDLEFILELKEKIDEIPQNSDHLRQILTAKGVNVGPDSRDRSSDPISNILDYNRYPHEINVFGLYGPHNFNFNSWTKKSRIGDVVKNFEKNDVNNRFLQAVAGFSIYYVGFLACMNLEDEGERHRRLDELLDVFFDEPLSYGSWSQKKLNEISPSENRMIWDGLLALNILISQEDSIKPAARYRAIRALTRYGSNKLVKIMEEWTNLGDGYSAVSPLSAFAIETRKLLQRLPRSFRYTSAEKSEVVSNSWVTNEVMLDFFGVKDRNWFSNVNYAGGINRLITERPYEAVQVCLLLLSDSGKTQEAGLSGLISMAQLDSVTAEQVFGYNATYLTMGSMAETIAEQVAGAAGVVAFGGDPAAPYKNLPQDELLLVVRRLLEENHALQTGRVGQMIRESARYFSETPPDRIQKNDPKGYFKTLGLHPELEFVDMDIILGAAYRQLAKLYHPDSGQKPDEERMIIINIAYEALETREKRESYRGHMPFTTYSFAIPGLGVKK